MTQPQRPTFDAWLDDDACGSICEMYRGGMRHGWHCRLYKDGTLACEGSFVDGRMEGHWVFFAADGQLLHNIEFDQGRPVDLHLHPSL
mgnify:CR=1 FL=1